MGKLKDVILEFNNQVNSNELSTLAGASGIADIEVGDETITEIKTKLSGLMSMEAAQNNHDLEATFKKKLYPTIKGELLGNIDTDLVNTAKDLFGEDAPDQFKDIEFTSDKVKKFAELTKGLIAKGANDSELKKLNEGLKNQIDELSKGFQKDLSRKDKEIQKINQGFNDRLIQKEFNSQAANYSLGEKYTEPFVKKALFNEVFSNVQKKAKLTLNDEGSIIPMNPENSEMKLFIDNKEVDFKSLLDAELAPYIKKSGPRDDGPTNNYKPIVDTGKISTMALERMKRMEEAN
jgi:hypothetical protein